MIAPSLKTRTVLETSLQLIKNAIIAAQESEASKSGRFKHIAERGIGGFSVEQNEYITDGGDVGYEIVFKYNDGTDTWIKKIASGVNGQALSAEWCKLEEIVK